MPSPNGIIGIVIYGFIFFMALLALFVPLFIFQIRDAVQKMKKTESDMLLELTQIKAIMHEMRQLSARALKPK